MLWPEFKRVSNIYWVTCPFCGKELCYTHPPTGKGRYPQSFMNHLMKCNPWLTCRERSDVAVKAWSNRSEVVS